MHKNTMKQADIQEFFSCERVKLHSASKAKFSACLGIQHDTAKLFEAVRVTSRISLRKSVVAPPSRETTTVDPGFFARISSLPRPEKLPDTI